MARRRHRNVAAAPVIQPFDVAIQKTLELERAVCYRTVTRDFTFRDVTEFLWAPTVLRILRDANGVVPLPWSKELTETVKIGDALQSWVFTVDFTNTNMAPILPGYITPQDTPKAPAILRALDEVADVVTRWNNVRTVIDWLNRNATPAVARYYFPALGSLLPAEHPYHSVTSPRASLGSSIHEVAPKIREAASTIASGLLSYTEESAIAPKGAFAVLHRQPTPSGVDMVSQAFVLA